MSGGLAAISGVLVRRLAIPKVVNGSEFRQVSRLINYRRSWWWQIPLEGESGGDAAAAVGE